MNDLDRIFAKLTPAQQRVMTFQGWSFGDGMLRPPSATAKALVRKGLAIEHERKLGCGMTILEYEVPIPIHMAWCAYCSRKFDESEALTEQGGLS